MRNDELEETWKNKEKFYEDAKGLSMLEIIKKIEKKYKVQVTAHNEAVYASPRKRLVVPHG
jgi:hypothetical protein